MQIFPVDALSGGGGLDPILTDKTKPEENNSTEQSGKNESFSSVSIFSSYDNTKDGVLSGSQDSSAKSYMQDAVDIKGETLYGAPTANLLAYIREVNKMANDLIDQFVSKVEISIGSKENVQDDAMSIKTAQNDIDAEAVGKMKDYMSSINSQIQSAYDAEKNKLKQAYFAEGNGSSNDSGATNNNASTASSADYASYPTSSSQQSSSSTSSSESDTSSSEQVQPKIASASDGSINYDTGNTLSGFGKNSRINMPNVNVSSLAGMVEGATSETASDINTELSTSLSNIDNALNSAKAELSRLGAEKTTAENNIARLETTVDQLAQDRQATKSALSKSESILDESIAQRNAKDAELAAVDADYGNACDKVKTCESNKESAQTKYSDAQTATAKAEADFNTASQDRAAAKEALDTADPKSDEYSQIKANFDAAVRAEESAKKELDNAKNAEKSAKEELDNAVQELNVANDEKTLLLKKRTETNDQYSQLAQACIENSNIVQVNQDNYDNTLHQHDETNSNYVRYKTELSNNQGIISQYNQVVSQNSQLSQQRNEIANLQSQLKSKYPNV